MGCIYGVDVGHFSAMICYDSLSKSHDVLLVNNGSQEIQMGIDDLRNGRGRSIFVNMGQNAQLQEIGMTTEDAGEVLKPESSCFFH